jgi:hypothetical protein
MINRKNPLLIWQGILDTGLNRKQKQEHEHLALILKCYCINKQDLIKKYGIDHCPHHAYLTGSGFRIG